MNEIAKREISIVMQTEFDQFWASYPRRTGKGLARKAFTKAIQKTTLTVMLDALQWQCRQPQWLKDGGTFVPHPSTWLNQERWDDEPFHNRMPNLSDKSVRMLQTMRMPSGVRRDH
jgi:hypothetical protein